MGAGALVQNTCNLAAGLLIAGTSVAAAITSGIAVGFSGRPHQCVSGDHRQDTNL